jgi:hypothetical protein
MEFVGKYFAYREGTPKKGEIERGQIIAIAAPDNYLVKFWDDACPVLIWIGCMRGWYFADSPDQLKLDDLLKIRNYGGRSYY